MKRTYALLATLLTLCAGATTLALTAPVASAAGTQNIVQIAEATPQLSTLVTLVKKAGLVKALSGSTKLTVFAPTNAAFAALPKATVEKLESHPKLLAQVLEYHVVAGTVPAAKVLKLHSAKTLEGSTVRFSVRDGHAYVNSSEIIKTNVFASNGVVHLINRVLTIPS